MDTFKVILKPVRHIALTLIVLTMGSTAFAELVESDFTYANLKPYGITESLLESKGHTLDSYKAAVLNDIVCLGAHCSYEVKNLRSMNNMQVALCEATTNDSLCMKIRIGGGIRIDRNRQVLHFNHEDEEILKKLKLYSVLLDEVVKFRADPEILVGVKIYAITQESLKNFEFGFSGFSGAPDSVSNPFDFSANPTKLAAFLGGGNSDLFRFQLDLAVGNGQAKEVVSYTTRDVLGSYFQVTDLKNVFRDNTFGGPNEAQAGLNFSGVFYPHPEDPNLLWLDSSSFYYAFDETTNGGTIRQISSSMNNQAFVSGKGKLMYYFLSDANVWEKQTGLQFKRNKGKQQIVNLVEVFPMVLESPQAENSKVKVSAMDFSDDLLVDISESGRDRFIHFSLQSNSLSGYSSEVVSLKASYRKKSVEALVTVEQLLSPVGVSLKLPRGAKNELMVRVQSLEQKRYEPYLDAVAGMAVAPSAFIDSWLEAFEVRIGLDRNKEIESLNVLSLQ